MGVPARVYRRLTEALSRAGFDVVIVPRRGIEEGSEPPSRRSDWSYADEADDLADAVAAARADDTETRVLVLGHSLGAQLAAMVALREDHAPDGDRGDWRVGPPLSPLRPARRPARHTGRVGRPRSRGSPAGGHDAVSAVPRRAR
ncbi:alpha/beta fold hydrolase [Gordonia terrae]|nr:alpha/beta fold hydrolase [Gordonia terrae]